MTPYLAALDRRRHQRRRRSSSSDRHDRSSSIVAPNPANNNSAKTKWRRRRRRPRRSCRPAAAAPTRRPEQVPRARESNEHELRGQISGDRSVPRPPAPCASDEQAPPLSVLQIFRSVVDDPLPRRARRRRHQRRHRSSSSDRHDRSSSIVAPNPATNNSTKTNGDGAAGDRTIVRPAAAAPTRRPEQVPRARESNQHELRGKILVIVQCRGRQCPARAMTSAPSVSAADFPIGCR